MSYELKLDLLNINVLLDITYQLNINNNINLKEILIQNINNYLIKNYEEDLIKQIEKIIEINT